AVRQSGANGPTMPVTGPPYRARICSGLRPSVAPPRASPTAAPARTPIAPRSNTLIRILFASCRLRFVEIPRSGAANARGPRPPGKVLRAGHLGPAIGQLLPELVKGQLALEVLLERGRRDLRLPLRVGRRALERRDGEELAHRRHRVPAVLAAGLLGDE